MDLASVKAKIEAILLVTGNEGISSEKLAKALSLKPSDVLEAIKGLESDYANRGIRLMVKEGEWQLVTAPVDEVSEAINNLIKSEYTESLSKAALEVLAIIAYKGPLTRSEIEYIRGVNSTFSLRNLLLRGLIERIDNPKDARSYIYKISFEFLKHMGVLKNEDLPEWSEYRATPIDIPKPNNDGENLV